MNLLETARKTLEVGQYSTSSGTTEDSFYFEDQSLFGLVWIAPNIESIVRDWEKRQDQFLAEREKQLRRLREKSWNAYSVVLCEADPTAEQKNALAKIEEDFRGSRKVVGTGLRAGSQVVRTLLPLLQIQNPVMLQEANAVNRLRTRLSSSPSEVLEALLEKVPAAEIARMLLSSYENPPR